MCRKVDAHQHEILAISLIIIVCCLLFSIMRSGKKTDRVIVQCEKRKKNVTVVVVDKVGFFYSLTVLLER